MEVAKKEPEDLLEEETYKKIISAISHPVRRRILRLLADKPQKFSDLHETLKITSSHLSYHINQLGELLGNENGTYKLSIFGKAGINLMESIEGRTQKQWVESAIQYKGNLAYLIQQEYKKALNSYQLEIGLGVLILGLMFCFVLLYTIPLPITYAIFGTEFGDAFPFLIYDVVNFISLAPILSIYLFSKLYHQRFLINQKDQQHILAGLLLHLGVICFGLIMYPFAVLGFLGMLEGLWILPLWYIVYANLIAPFIILYQMWLSIRGWTINDFNTNFISKHSKTLNLTPQTLQNYIHRRQSHNTGTDG